MHPGNFYLNSLGGATAKVWDAPARCVGGSWREIVRMNSIQASRAKALYFTFIFICLSALSPLAYGQAVKASLYGTVTDPNDAVIPGANVRLLNEGTAAAFNTTTDSYGAFTFSGLSDGAYTVTIESPGFKQLNQTNLRLSAGAVVRQTFTLSVGEVSETVEVVADAVLVNAANAEQRMNIDSAEIQQLPTMRRDWTNLVGLGAGMQTSGPSARLNGLPGGTLRITVDGTDATQDTEQPSFTMSGNFNFIKGVGMEAIEEVNVAKGIASAEIANTMSGNVNITTRRGTNDFHGSLFWLNNTEEYNARSQFLTNKPNMVFNQYGGSFGGPILRNKLFFFGAYEGYQLRGFAGLNGNVPTAEFRERISQANPIYNKTLALFPLPNQAYSPTSNTGQWIGSGSARSDDNHVDARTDWSVTDSTLLSVRYSRGRPNRMEPRVVEANNRTYAGVIEQGNVNLTHASATWTFETRLGVNYNKVPRLDGIYSLYLADTSVNGIDGLGFSVDGENLAREGNSWSLEELATKNVGRHTLKFGGIFLRSVGMRANAETPILTYSSFEDLVENIPNRGRVTMGINEFRLTTNTYGVFFQDDYRVNRNLILNLGIRYDYFTVPKERDGRLFNRAQPFGTGPFVNPNSIWDADRNNFSPRVGFAYSFGANQETVIRGGVGMFHAPGTLFGGPVDLVRNAADEPFRVEYSRQEALQYSQYRWPVSNQAVTQLVKGQPALDSGTAINTHYPNAFSYQWLFTIQRQLTDSLALETGYVGNRGVNLTMVRFWNAVDRQTGFRPYANLGEFRYRDAGESTAYNSWQTTLRKRFSQGFLFNVNYTFANGYSYTDQADLILPGSVQDSYNVRIDKGLPNSDIRHTLNIDAVYELPFFRDASSPAFLRNVLGGWQLSGINSIRSGQPFNISQSSGLEGSRPDYIGGEAVLDNYRDTLVYFDTSRFTRVPIGAQSGVPIRPGNVGRNALRGPGLWNLDFSAAKRFFITERISAKIDAQMLNALNHTNYNNPQTNITSGSFGRISGTRGARTIQFGLRLTF